MFAKNFLDVFAFATPDYIWFVSPLLGLFPALITQAFLLRRITLFLSSLSSLWPALDRSAVKMTFVIFMSGAIVVSFLSGCIGSYYIWKSGPLWDDFVRHSTPSVHLISQALRTCFKAIAGPDTDWTGRAFQILSGSRRPVQSTSSSRWCSVLNSGGRGGNSLQKADSWQRSLGN